MKKSDEFLDSLGLKRKTKDSRKELSEVMRRTQWGNYTGSETTAREVDESTATQVLHLAFEEWGSLHIKNPERFFSQSEIKEFVYFPKEVFAISEIYFSSYFNNFMVSVNNQIIKKMLQEKNEKMINLAKIASPEFELKKVFNNEEALEETAEKLDQIFCGMVQLRFEEEMKEKLLTKYPELFLNDAFQLVDETEEKWFFKEKAAE